MPLSRQQALITIDQYPDVYWTSVSGVNMVREVAKYKSSTLQSFYLAGAPEPEQITLMKPANKDLDAEIFNDYMAWHSLLPGWTVRIQPVTSNQSTIPIGKAIICHNCIPLSVNLPEFDADTPTEHAVLTLILQPESISVD